MTRRSGAALADVPGDGMHQVGLAEADAAIEEQRIEWHGRGIRDPVGRRIGELVGLADDEILEGEPRIEHGAEEVSGRRVIGVSAVEIDRGYRLGLDRPPGGPAIARSRQGRASTMISTPLSGRILRLPEGEQPIAVVGHDPVAHEARRHGHFHVLAANLQKRQLLQPVFVGGLADFGPQPAAHPRPLRLNLFIAGLSGHSTGPYH